MKNWLTGLAASLVVALLFVGAGAAPASAHSALQSSNPSSGAVLREAPPVLELVFNEHLRDFKPLIAITVGDAAPVEIVPTVDEHTVTADLSAVSLPGVAPGTSAPWKVGYRVVSEDGHPVAGVLQFTVDRTLASSNPGQGAVLTEAPQQVELNFGELVVVQADPAALTAGDLPETQVPATADGHRVVVDLSDVKAPAPSPQQQWRIGYRVADADGTIRTGLVAFVVDPADPAATAPVSISVPTGVTPGPVSISAPPGVTSTESPTTTGQTATAVAPASPAGGASAAPEEDNGSAFIWVLIGLGVFALLGVALLVRRRTAGNPS